MKDKNFLTIGEVAKKMNTTVRTLQYYDQEGILKPSQLSDGGRRLYTSKDIVQLHQILTLKYLGFSLEDIKNKIYKLDTPEEVAIVLEEQQKSIEEEIINLQKVLTSISSLKEEVLKMKSVNFDKYANIISSIRLGNDYYWVFNAFDDTLSNHVKERFSSRPELGEKILTTYNQLLNETINLKRKGESPKSDKCKDLAKRWWQMVNDFTGGDMSLLPNLEEFNADKSNWDESLALKQKEADEFIDEVLNNYFKDLGMDI
ncbi:MAG: MerR family transcriptional regulator [Coprobacillus sp.]